MARVIVKRQGRTWGIYLNGNLVEGGFFSRHIAEEVAAEYRAGEA